jgi:hypothetical protein
MWWEIDADKEESTGGALVRTVKEALGQLEWRENELGYPGSSKSIHPGCHCRVLGLIYMEFKLMRLEYDNLRKGMQ